MEPKKLKSGAQILKTKKQQQLMVEKLPKLNNYVLRKKKPDEVEVPVALTTDVVTPANINLELIESGICKDTTGDNSENNIMKNDLGHYLNKELTDNEKRFIISQTPYRPKGPFPRNLENKCFSETFYFASSKSKYRPVPRFWL